MRHSYYTSLLLATSALGAGLSLPTVAQETDAGTRASSMVLEEAVVTARRREELLQEVPASIQVFNQQQLDNANIVNAADLAAYTPSLAVNNRFGGDNTTFAIRGFSQELRTTASVGVYFAEVVAPRGANSQQSGDGAGPGDFFDLVNVQVLKGPQGTLFGRNTTGGAILLTPQRPTDEFEGYVEGSAGDYDMWRGQGVINLPGSDSFKLRLGIDSQQRDGYLDNFSGIGPDDFANIDYTAYRLSALWNITDSLENYTILRYTDSQNNGYPGSLFYCNTEERLGSFVCQPDLDNRKATGHDGFYDVYSFVPNPVSKLEQSQVINTTTWDINANFRFKNILSYASLQTDQRSAIYGTDWSVAGAFLIFQMVGLASDLHTTDQESWVEEAQIQGTNFDERLTWQAGLYYEKSEPIDDYGAQSPALISCDLYTLSGSPEDIRCNNIARQGAVQRTPGGVEYTNQAVYAQATYDLNTEFALTAGLRYTDDKTEGDVTDTIYFFPAVAPGSYAPYSSTFVERRTPKEDSSKPTWLLGLDYTPNDETLVYGKYTRGYRQGSVNVGGATGLDTHGPETVDTYEIGTKLTFSGDFPAIVNVAAFYNDFKDQQVQFGYFKTSGVGSTAVVNAGSSTIWGVEYEGNVQLTDNFILSASYTYLDTNVDKLEFPPVPPNTIANEPIVTTAEGEPLSYAPKNKLALTGAYNLPVSADTGDMTFAVTYVYTDKQQANSKETSPYATLADTELVNVNFNWNGIFGSGFDASAFVTNATDEEYITFMTGNWNSGLESGQVGVPRMYGARIRYNF